MDKCHEVARIEKENCDTGCSLAVVNFFFFFFFFRGSGRVIDSAYDVEGMDTRESTVVVRTVTEEEIVQYCRCITVR